MGELVADQPAAAAGKDGWPIDRTRPLLLAAAGRESPDAATVWKHGAADQFRIPAQSEDLSPPPPGAHGSGRQVRIINPMAEVGLNPRRSFQ